MPISRQRVLAYLDANFPRPALNPVWLLDVLDGLHALEVVLEINADDNFEPYGEELKRRIIQSKFSDIMEPGTGLPRRIGSSLVHTTLEGPVILELVYLTDVGVSAFSLERIRQDRDQTFYLDLLALSRVRETASQARLQMSRHSLPDYPRGVLKLYLSDGSTELEALELKRLPLQLGHTAMGVKVRLEHVPIIGGVAYLEPANCTVIGGYVEERESDFVTRLRGELSIRMQQELELVQAEDVNPTALYSPSVQT